MSHLAYARTHRAYLIGQLWYAIILYPTHPFVLRLHYMNLFWAANAHPVSASNKTH